MTSKFDDLEKIASWNRILKNSSTGTIFITPTWQEIWVNNYKPQSDIYLEIVQKDGIDLGVVPLMDTNGRLSFIGDSDVYDYMDFPVLNGYESLFYESAAEMIQSLKWENLKLESIPEDSPTLKLLPQFFSPNNFEVVITESDCTPLLQLPNNWDDYQLNLRKKDRHELRRKIRRLESSHSFKQFRCDLNSNSLEMYMNTFFNLMAQSREDKGEFLTDLNKSFFKELAKIFSYQDSFNLYFLELDEQIVAACICFEYEDQVLLYNSGYNPEFSSLSVGLINKAFTIKESIENEMKVYNFLRGTERYKYHLGAQDKLVMDLSITRL